MLPRLPADAAGKHPSARRKSAYEWPGDSIGDTQVRTGGRSCPQIWKDTSPCLRHKHGTFHPSRRFNFRSARHPLRNFTRGDRTLLARGAVVRAPGSGSCGQPRAAATDLAWRPAPPQRSSGFVLGIARTGPFHRARPPAAPTCYQARHVATDDCPVAAIFRSCDLSLSAT